MEQAYEDRKRSRRYEEEENNEDEGVIGGVPYFPFLHFFGSSFSPFSSIFMFLSFAFFSTACVCECDNQIKLPSKIYAQIISSAYHEDRTIYMGFLIIHRERERKSCFVFDYAFLFVVALNACRCYF